MQEPQNFANHKRIDPIYHLVASPFVLLGGIAAAVNFVLSVTGGAPGREVVGAFAILLVATGLVIITIRVRIYALMLQDRVIQTEVALRYAETTGQAFAPIAARLSRPQIVALRFAGNEELRYLAHRAAEENLPPTEIKKAIRHWRPDASRV